MQVVLSITSYQRQSMGEQAQYSFGESGGTFGRGTNNQWVLADPDRIISSQHGQISFQNSCFYLTDLSTNGIFVSDKLVAVGKGSSVALSHGEVIRFGEYEVSVSLPNEAPLVADRNLGSDPAQLSVEDSLNIASDFDILGSAGQALQSVPTNNTADHNSSGISAPDFDPLGIGNNSDAQVHLQPSAGADSFSAAVHGTLSDQGAQSNHTDALTDPFVAPQASHQDSPQPSVQVSAGLVGGESQVDPFATAAATNQPSSHIPDDWDLTDFSVDSQVEIPKDSEPVAPSPIIPSPMNTSEQQSVAGPEQTTLDDPFANLAAPSTLPDNDVRQEIDLAVPSTAQTDGFSIQDNFCAPPIDDPFADPVTQELPPNPDVLAATEQAPPTLHHLDQNHSEQGSSNSALTSPMPGAANNLVAPEKAQLTAEANAARSNQVAEQISEQADQPSGVAPPSLGAVPQIAPAAEAQSHTDTEPRTEHNTQQQANDFMQALGVDAALLNELDQTQVMREFGGLFREMLKGLIELQQARSLLKNEFRMSLTTIRPIENNPLKFAPNIDEALRIFLAHKGSGYLNADESIKESIAEIRNHQIAMISAMESAFSQLIQRLSPEHFADSNNQSGVLKAAMQSLGKKSNAWQNYVDFYQDQVVDSGNAFQLLFGDAFVDAYEQQIKHISANKNSDRS